MTFSDDLYACGWDAGYGRALIDVSAETARITDPLARIQLRRVLEALRYQHMEDGGAPTI